jgi:hypothetical protein
MQLEVRDHTVFATVVASNDAPADPVGTVYRFVPDRDHRFRMVWVRGNGSHRVPGGIMMCNDTLTKDRKACGA